MSDIEVIRNQLTLHTDFPKKGVNFIDIFPIFRDPGVFEILINHLVDHITSVTLPKTPNNKIDVVVGLDARGFLIGPIVALKLGAAFVPVRKRGKLPGKCVSASYEKEYAPDIFEMQVEAIKPGQNAIVLDDVIATGGSAKAAGDLVTQLGGTVIEYVFMIEIPSLDGAARLNAPLYSMIQIEKK
ncbi:adenine phosphoribosyltransferase [Amanita muscaria]